ncbi:MAG: outer membrane beta-barrel protein [Ginsengibacter sp.]
MTKLSPFIFLFISTILIHTAVFGQKKDSTYNGVIKGIVNDSAHNYVLPSASVAVYKTEGNELLSYQLSNNFGEFHFKEMPVGISLKVIVSYSGYKNFSKEFKIPMDKKEIDLKKLVVERSEGTLEEVVVKYIPPIQMNGDTLEFNADAFKLDSNAVVEDLLRKLPGVTVWGDGEITVNGKKVNSVYVDGKPFFGGDTRVATQNLPKNAIDKIQVYQQKNESNPLDSTTNVNIKLKENKKVGYFGKLGGGYGTNDRYEANASINIFSPKTQFSIVAAENNTNKTAFDINTLMRNASYKGVGASVDYQPDFQARGLNRPRSGGFTFQHDFIPDADYYKNNRLTANYFITNDKKTNISNTETIRDLGDGNSLNRTDFNETGSTRTSHRFNSEYDFRNQNGSLTISPSFNVNNSRDYSIQNGSSMDADNKLQSFNSSYNENNTDSKNVTFNVKYNNKKTNVITYTARPPKTFHLDYNFYAGNSNNQRLNKTRFESPAEPTQNKLYDRRYDNTSNDINQNLNFTLDDLKGLFFKYKRLAGIQIQFTNYLYLNAREENNKVGDRDTVSKNYNLNNYLTNKSSYNTFNDLPGINFSKSFNKGLANRYSKSVTIQFKPEAQFYVQKNVSQKAFQNFEHSYARFIPGAGINYRNDQYGAYQATYSLNYKASADYPRVDQLAPLVDSSNVYYIQKGNPNLKPYYKQELSFNFQMYSSRSKNPLNYNISMRAGFINDYMADSSIYDDLGRNIHYTVNADGHKYLSANGSLNKSFKVKQNTLQVMASTFLNLAKNPNYLNNVFYMSTNFNSSNNVNLYYSFRDFLSMNIGESLSTFHSVRNGEKKQEFKNATITTSFSASVNVTKKLSLGSNVKYNRNTSSSSKAIDFTIWNASLDYRFLKGNNAEVKLMALDLLHQNTSIISYGDNYSITRGTANVLQQYFMVSFSYFPRKFGRKEK